MYIYIYIYIYSPTIEKTNIAERGGAAEHHYHSYQNVTPYLEEQINKTKKPCKCKCKKHANVTPYRP